MSLIRLSLSCEDGFTCKVEPKYITVLTHGKGFIKYDCLSSSLLPKNVRECRLTSHRTPRVRQSDLLSVLLIGGRVDLYANDS